MPEHDATDALDGRKSPSSRQTELTVDDAETHH